MSYEISVVVPVYKVEQYLDRCVESILQQSFPDFEVILVDDGSPDRCPEICEAWAEKDSRVKVIHKANGGLPDARNAGIRVAQGRYVAFVDSDDWVEADFLQILYRGITEQEADVVQCNFRYICDGWSRPCAFPAAVWNGEAVRQNLMDKMVNELPIGMSNSRWNKIYKAEHAKAAAQMCDISVSMGEDYLFNFAVFGQCSKVVVLDTPPVYNYFYNPVSISGSYNPNHKKSKKAFYENIRMIAQTYGITGIDMTVLLHRRYTGYLYECATSSWKLDARRQEIKEIFRMIDKSLWWKCVSPITCIPEKICVWMVYFHMITPMLILVDLVKKIKKIP